MRDELSAILSNRSAAYFESRDFISALADAESVIQLKRPWSKGHFRKASALVGLNRLDEASNAMALGLAYDPENQVLTRASLSLTRVTNSPVCRSWSDSSRIFWRRRRSRGWQKLRSLRRNLLTVYNTERHVPVQPSQYCTHTAPNQRVSFGLHHVIQDLINMTDEMSWKSRGLRYLQPSRSSSSVNVNESKQGWREWAGNKLKYVRGSDNSTLDIERIALFPGWCARRYHSKGHNEGPTMDGMLLVSSA